MQENLPSEAQSTPSQESQLPADTQKRGNFFSPIKKIFFIIIAVVCFFGIVQIISQNLFPAKSDRNQTRQTAPPISDWKTYKNKTYKYSVEYPGHLKFSEAKYSTVFVPEKAASEVEEFPDFYISVIPQGTDNTRDIYNFMSEDIVAKFFSMRDGEALETQSWPYAEYSTFKKLAVIPLLGTSAVVIENPNVLKGDGRINRRILLKKGESTIIIGSFYKTQQELDSFRRFLESFSFTN